MAIIERIENLKPYKKNAKKHEKKQIILIAESIKRFGFDSPIIVDKNNEIIAGHGRLEAAKLLQMMEVPVIRKETLTEDEVKAYRLADNKIAESEWDMELVMEELKELSSELFTLTGFDSDLLIEPDENDDVIPEVKVPVSVLGDLYVLGEHRVLCGDSTKIEDVNRLMDGKKADMVFTDPPYGVDYSGGLQFKNGQGKIEQRDRLIADSSEEIYTLAIPMMAEYCDGAIYTWFAGTKAGTIYTAVENVGDLHSLIIWVKNGGYGALNANYKQKHEACLYWKKKGGKLNFIGETTETTIWNIDKDGINKLHPTQKPVALALKAILNHKAETIMDLFLGSGSTLIASEKTGRACYGMELDPKYIDVIVQRYVDFTGNENIIKNGEQIVWKQTQK